MVWSGNLGSEYPLASKLRAGYSAKPRARGRPPANLCPVKARPWIKNENENSPKEKLYFDGDEGIYSLKNMYNLVLVRKHGKLGMRKYETKSKYLKIRILAHDP
jgi:hypothetical protein